MDIQVHFRVDDDRVARFEQIKAEYYKRGLKPPILSVVLRDAYDDFLLKCANQLNDKKLVAQLKREAQEAEYKRRCGTILKLLDLPDYQNNLIDKVVEKHGRKNKLVKELIRLNKKIARARGLYKHSKAIATKTRKQKILVTEVGDGSVELSVSNP